MIERPASAAEILGVEVSKQIKLLSRQLERERTLLQTLLRNTATPGQCGCGAAVLWVMHASGQRTPYDLDGLNHHVTCANAPHTTSKL